MLVANRQCEGCASTLEEVCNEFDLAPIPKSRMNDTSGGQLHRVHLAAGLSSNADQLLLDEPTAAAAMPNGAPEATARHATARHATSRRAGQPSARPAEMPRGSDANRVAPPPERCLNSRCRRGPRRRSGQVQGRPADRIRPRLQLLHTTTSKREPQQPQVGNTHSGACDRWPKPDDGGIPEGHAPLLRARCLAS